MKRIVLISLVVFGLIFPSFAFAATTKTIQATVTWDGKDADGNTEASLPISINLYKDGATPAVVSTLSLSAASTSGEAMPTFTLTVEDNTTTTFSFYATATDSAGNISGKSSSVSVTLTGSDTIAPGTPVIKLQLSN